MLLNHMLAHCTVLLRLVFFYDLHRRGIILASLYPCGGSPTYRPDGYGLRCWVRDRGKVSLLTSLLGKHMNLDPLSPSQHKVQ